MEPITIVITDDEVRTNYPPEIEPAAMRLSQHIQRAVSNWEAEEVAARNADLRHMPINDLKKLAQRSKSKRPTATK